MARMPLMPHLAYLAIPVTALVLAACGGSSSATAHLPTQPSATAPAAPGLVTFNHTGFSIGLLPGKRDRLALSVHAGSGDAKFVLYLVRRGDLGTAIGSFSEPLDQASMMSTFDSAARTAQGAVHDARQTTYQGFTARDARIASKTNDVTLFVRTIRTATRTYLLEYIAKGSDHTTAPAGYATFLASLKLT